ncbi:glycine zipper domain-containing protein [Trinickia fusca]|uniref:Glycine zipper family protein n=1 Tax=Trinickia fusca TaxID=2419777 RepID=A0A494X4E5_9BURK|nr:glycine zipper domain-containing protein [Trinickia fusca]RKP45565.1 glycine zipper family protein [Trinickia fusca]
MNAPRLTRPLVFGLALFALAGCAVVPPSYPTVTALPAKGKALTEFQQDDYSCRTYASQIVDPIVASHPVAQSGAAGPALGTAAGAAAGALIGAGTGSAGVGAAIGAGAGLLFGSAVGGQQHQQSEAALQRQYDDAYAQCITTKGDTIATPAAPALIAPAPAVVYTTQPYYYVPY